MHASPSPGLLARALPLADRPYWMVRAGRRGMHAAAFKSDGVVATGWYEIDWTTCADLKAIKTKLRIAVPSASRHQRIAIASQIERYVRTMQAGDRVVTYDGFRRLLLLGALEGRPVYKASAGDGLVLQRPVTWYGAADRDRLSRTATKALGAMSRLFAIDDSVAAELEANCQALQ